MSHAPGQVSLNCFHCQQLLTAPTEAIGREIRCPNCNGVFLVPGAPAAVSPAAPPVRRAPELQPQASQLPTPQPGYAAPSAEQSGFPFIRADEESVADRAKKLAPQESTGGNFAPEKKGLEYGVVGGIAMMVIAAIWFFAGLAANRIFFYPPILFCIGLYGCITGLADGNIAGKRRRR